MLFAALFANDCKTKYLLLSAVQSLRDPDAVTRWGFCLLPPTTIGYQNIFQSKQSVSHVISVYCLTTV